MLATAQPERRLRGYIILGAYKSHPYGGMRGCPSCLPLSLGAITAEQAADQIFPSSKITGTAGQNQQAWQGLETAASTGQIVLPSCTAVGGASVGSANDLKLAGQGASLSLTAATTTGLIAAGPATLGISIAIAGIVGIFSTILNHHAQAVQKEQSVLCSAIPAANNYLNIISQAVQSGQSTPQEAISALNSLLSDFTSTVSSIEKGSIGTGTCNAACVYTAQLAAIVAYQTSQYQDLAAQQATQVTSGNAATSGTVTSGSTLNTAASSAAAAVSSLTSSLPSWWPIAALALFGIFALKEF
jgi:hypothetical protein